ncbi:hypothetical protein BJY24_003314 [Nocardia transvalensis]|uniref:Uncharacterized protein n=1 Tax=Nocardia transvalensis TaxID=37333 RepID=A0A7W9UIQ8_9NOCA|nr:hypothetical protein [Nocardia transvalensis]MBB5914447.1 hypothetical protein [Nocardia transvalensis]
MDTVTLVAKELWQVTLAALIFGAGLPAIFAFGVRFHSRATVSADGGAAVSPGRRRAAAATAALCFAVVLVAVVAGVLFVAKAFLAARLGIHLFGQG